MPVEAKNSIVAVRDWILSRHPERKELHDDTDLIEGGLVDSLSFVDFVFVIEAASGSKIDLETIDVDNFRSLAAIARAYFEGRS